MLNFSYSFNRAKRHSKDANETSYPHSPKSIFHRRSDSIDHGYFPKNAVYQRRSEGSDTLNSDFRENSTYSYTDSPTGFKRYNNTANTSIVSQPVIDLNNVLKETSKFKRSLSYPSQNTQNRRNAGEYSLNGYPIAECIPNYSSKSKANEYAYILFGDDLDLAMTQGVPQTYESNAMSRINQEHHNEKDKENEIDPEDYDIDEVLFAGQLTDKKVTDLKPRTATKIRILPEASEELLSRLQLINAGIVDVPYKSKNEDENDNEDEDEDRSDNDIKGDRDRHIKNGQKKKTFISKTISRLNPGL